jgi:hypothetical protein
MPQKDPSVGGPPLPGEPEFQAHRHEVLEQLERLLTSHLFKHSKRCPSLLQYVVKETVGGRGKNLKERVIGIEVFGREADYDVNEDAVVRQTASEVRERIAQYYQEPGRETELRIVLNPGSYVPEFHLPATEAVLTPVNFTALKPQPEPISGNQGTATSPIETQSHAPRQKRGSVLILGGLICIVAIGAGIVISNAIGCRIR